VQVESEDLVKKDVQVGAKVTIDPGTDIEEDNEVKAFGSLVLLKPLKFAHAAGAKITIQSSSKGSSRRRRTSSDSRRRRRSNDNGDDDDFDFGNPTIEKPDDHFKNLEKVIRDSADKSIKPVLEEIKEVTEKAEEVAKQHGDTNLKEAVEPLVEGFEKLEAEVKKGAKARKDMDEAMSKVHEEIQDAHETITKAAKGAASAKDVQGAQDAVSDDIKAMKAHALKGFNKAGKVAIKNQKYAKAIYEDLHH
jgi:methyl-accepting chemotaxis protein